MKNITEEIHKLLNSCGNKYEHLLIQLPLELVDIKDSKVQSGNKDQAKMSFLLQEMNRLMTQPSFLRYAPQAFENLQVSNMADYLMDLFKTLKFQTHDQLGILVALTHSNNPNYRSDTIKLLKKRLKEYYVANKPQPLISYVAHELLLMMLTLGDFSDDPMFQHEIAQFIRDSMCKSSASHPFELDPFFASQFSPLYKLSEDIGKGFSPAVALQASTSLTSLLQHGHMVDLADILLDCESIISHNLAALQALCSEYKDSEMNEQKMAELLIKLANGCTKTQEKIDVVPSSILFQSSKPGLKHSGQPIYKALADSDPGAGWNLDNLARVLKEILGKGSWDKVIKALDQPGLDLDDTNAFH